MKFEIAPKETEIVSNWHDAKMYCFSLNINNKTGWRLPTKDELNQICHSRNDFGRNWYWSSTEDEDYDEYVSIQYLDSGNQSYQRKHDLNHTRAIRDLTT